MIDHEKESNVLIIGAGASADFGVPLGRNVLDLAIGMSNDMAKRFRRDVYPFSDNKAEIDANSMSHAGLVRYFQPLGEIDPINFAEIMDSTSSQTVDNFALENPKYSDIARHLSSAVLVPRVFDLDRQSASSRRLRRMHNLGSGSTRNWIDLFISVVKERIRRGENTSWTIISFNYDGLVESHIRSRWSAEEVYGAFDARFEFIYPYGVFRPQGRFMKMSDLVTHLASSVRYAHELGEYDEALNRSWSRVRCAQELYVLGFACAKQNAEAIGLLTDKYQRKCPVHAQNFAGNRVLQQRLIEIGAEPEHIFKGSCSTLIDDGFFGELPT